MQFTLIDLMRYGEFKQYYDDGSFDWIDQRNNADKRRHINALKQVREESMKTCIDVLKVFVTSE